MADLGFWTGGVIYPAAGLDIEFGQVDANGVAWLWQRIDGWDSADVQGGGVIGKAGDHGGWASPQFYAPRVLTLTVSATAPSQAARDIARAQLQQAFPISDLATLRYDEPISKLCQVRRSGKITEKYLSLLDVEFTAILVAPDPRKYSTQVNSINVAAAASSGGFTVPFTVPFTPPAQPLAGSAALMNSGTFETRPVVAIQGPITSPALLNALTGQVVSWTGLTLAATDVLVVDFNLRQALLNGVFRSADLASSWWVLAAGTSSTIVLGGAAGAGCNVTFTWSNAWM